MVLTKYKKMRQQRKYGVLTAKVLQAVLAVEREALLKKQKSEQKKR
jgi:protein-L-isoaspartate O-methyltransferase